MRPKIFTTLLVAAFAVAACLFAAGAAAQRGGASRQASGGAAQGEKPKRVFVGRGSDTGKGSRVTITADDSLKDYSAYRSGDRFYVVLPKSAAGAARAGGAGKGYSDMQVQQRGDSVVLSYRVQPGAKPRVEQKFNRLDVVFDVPEGGQQSAATPAQANAGRATQPTPAENRNAAAAAQQASQAQATAQQQQNPAGTTDRRPTPAETAAQATQAAPANVGQTPVMVVPPTADPAQGVEGGAQPTAGQPLEAASPNASPSAEPQVAQAQPPAAVAPITTTQPAPDTQVAGTSIGTFLLRNWALVFALVIVGLGLLIAARRTTTQARPEGADAEGAGTPTLEEPRAVPLAVKTEARTEVKTEAKPAATATPAATTTPTVTATPAAAAPQPAAELDAVGEPSLDATPLAAAAALAGASAAKSRKQSRKEARQEAKKKKKGGRDASVSDVDESAEGVEDSAAGVDEKAAVSAVAEPVSEVAISPAVEEEATVTVEKTGEAVTVEEAPAAVEVAQDAAVMDAAAPSSAEVVTEPSAPAASTAEVFEPSAFVSQPSEFESRPSEVAEAAEVKVTEIAKVDDAEVTAVTATEAPAGVEHFVAPTAETETVEAETVEVAPVATGVTVERETSIEPAAVSEPEAFEPAALEEAPAEVTLVESTPARAEVAAPETFVEVTEIAPALAPDHDAVQAETRRLLEGGGYDRAVVGTRDPVARQMIGAELLSALAGRNAERRRRAGAAFVELGYFQEAASDLRGADAPAERAAAARSLALLGEHRATPHLIAALQDSSVDVRRAAVEALGSLRDPSAVPALEALIMREASERNRIPSRVIRTAVEFCREGREEEPAAEIRAAAPAVAEPAGETHEVVKGIVPVSDADAVEVTARAAEPASAVVPAPFVAPAPETEVGAAVEADAPSTAEITPYVPGGEDAAPAAPLVEEPGFESVTEAPGEVAAVSVGHVEPASAEAPRGEEEETLVVTAEALAADEAPAVRPGEYAFAEDLQAAADSRSLESAVVEPRAVVETGILPFVEREDVAAEASASEEVAAAPHAEVGLEPFVPREEEEAPRLQESAQPSADSERHALFGTDEAARGIEPFTPAASDRAEPSAGSAGEVATGEWFDLDMDEFHGSGRPAAADAYAARPATDAAVFESSSGETMGAHTVAEPFPAVVKQEPAPTGRAETTRELDLAGAQQPVTPPPRPAEARERAQAPGPESAEKGIAPLDEYSTVPASIQHRLASREASERAAAVVELSHVDTDEAFQQICAAFDDDSKEVRSAAARALYELRPERADSFTRALREASPERRRQIGASISTSGLAGEAVSQLTGESREKTYEAFSLLFLMAKAGEVQPLVRAIEGHPSNEVRLAVVKLLALSGQKEILPAFRRLAVRGSLPTEVRSAVMEAIYQISSSQPTHA